MVYGLKPNTSSSCTNLHHGCVSNRIDGGDDSGRGPACSALATTLLHSLNSLVSQSSQSAAIYNKTTVQRRNRQSMSTTALAFSLLYLPSCVKLVLRCVDIQGRHSSASCGTCAPKVSVCLCPHTSLHHACEPSPALKPGAWNANLTPT